MGGDHDGVEMGYIREEEEKSKWWRLGHWPESWEIERKRRSEEEGNRGSSIISEFCPPLIGC